MTLLDAVFNSFAFQIIGWTVVIFLVVFTLALAWWVYRDAVQRIENPLIHIAATVGVLLFNVLGLVIYVLLRPMQTRTEHEIEMLELDLLQSELKGTPKKKKAGKSRKSL